MTLNLVFLMHSLQLHLNAATFMSVSLMGLLLVAGMDA